MKYFLFEARYHYISYVLTCFTAIIMQDNYKLHFKNLVISPILKQQLRIGICMCTSAVRSLWESNLFSKSLYSNRVPYLDQMNKVSVICHVKHNGATHNNKILLQIRENSNRGSSNVGESVWKYDKFREFIQQNT